MRIFELPKFYGFFIFWGGGEFLGVKHESYVVRLKVGPPSSMLLAIAIPFSGLAPLFFLR